MANAIQDVVFECANQSLVALPTLLMGRWTHVGNSRHIGSFIMGNTIGYRRGPFIKAYRVSDKKVGVSLSRPNDSSNIEIDVRRLLITFRRL